MNSKAEKRQALRGLANFDIPLIGLQLFPFDIVSKSAETSATIGVAPIFDRRARVRARELICRN